MVIHYAPISSEDKLHQPINHTTSDSPYVNLKFSLFDADISKTEFAPFIASMKNSNPNCTDPGTIDATLYNDSFPPHINVFSLGYDHRLYIS